MITSFQQTNNHQNGKYKHTGMALSKCSINNYNMLFIKGWYVMTFYTIKRINSLLPYGYSYKASCARPG